VTVDELVKATVKIKARRMLQNKDYAKHLKEIIDELQASKDCIRIAHIGAIDAMIYDVISALSLSKPKRNKRKQ
jgi:hypothetical protein